MTWVGDALIGGILANKEKTTEQWEQVATRLTPAIATDREAYVDTLALSYQHLPLHLRACFLYLGSIFPEDYQIPVRRLVWLVVAEGFSIQENNDDQQIQSSEDTVEGYLNELVERSLVTIASKRPCGATKKIRIHDLLRDFCLVQGEQEKFTLKFEGLNTDVPSLESAEKGQCRFLVSSTDVFPRRSTSNLRSLFLSCYYTIRRESAQVFEQSFRLLKVLQVDRSLRRISNNFENLSSLRYLALLFRFDQPDTVFTSSVTKLLYLETLFLRTEQTINMPDDIWNMVKLRHLYNADKKGMFHFNSCPYQGAKRRLLDLQTLHTLCSCESCLENLVRIPNLKKLGLSGCFTIPDLGFLEQLVTLKVANNSILFSPRSNPLFEYKLPASLRKLTLEYTLLKWEEISVLAELENLEVLKLLDRACEDTQAWDTRDLEFPKLKYLKMRRLDIVKWDDSNLQFESLEVLVLENCRQLESIPFDLALSPSLHTMEVTKCNTLVERLAKEIEAEHECQCGNTDLQVVIKSF